MGSFIDRLQPVAQELLEAWLRLPRHDDVPLRESFNPMTVPRILPVVSLIQRMQNGEWCLRLVGTEIERRWGRALTGVNYADIMSPEAAESTLCEFEAICDQPCGSWSRRHVEMRSGSGFESETLRLPLRASDGGVTLILSCSGGLSGRFLHESDNSCGIVTVME
ncbi:MAG: PAS domain-containing protein, partial [Stellaceae bacterium]